MTFDYLKDKTLDELINKYNDRHKDSTVKKIGGCYTLNGLFYEPMALKRDLIYYEYTLNESEFDAKEKLKLMLYINKINFIESFEILYILSTGEGTKERVAEVICDYNANGEAYYLNNYAGEKPDRSTDLLTTVREIKKEVYKKSKLYFTVTDVIYFLDPFENRKIISWINTNSTKVKKLDREGIIREYQGEKKNAAERK